MKISESKGDEVSFFPGLFVYSALSPWPASKTASEFRFSPQFCCLFYPNLKEKKVGFALSRMWKCLWWISKIMGKYLTKCNQPTSTLPAFTAHTSHNLLLVISAIAVFTHPILSVNSLSNIFQKNNWTVLLVSLSSKDLTSVFSLENVLFIFTITFSLKMLPGYLGTSEKKKQNTQHW